jgi:hypothetical protein
MPYASGKIPTVGDYVKNKWEQPGTVLKPMAPSASDGTMGELILPLTPATEFTLISKQVQPE